MTDQRTLTAATVTDPRRVLMICYYFPPVLASGVARSVGFAKQLPKFDWAPHILTVLDAKESWESSVKSPVPEGLQITRSFELNLPGFFDFLQGGLNRIYRFFTGKNLQTPVVRRALGFPDAHIGWFLLPKAIRLSRQSDCIYVSCKPYSAAVLALVLRWITKKPLIVDFRDPWTAYLDSRKDRWLEEKVVRKCDRLILNTDEALSWYRKLYPRFANKMLAIPNGFDKPIEPDRKGAAGPEISIVHAGSFYLDRKPDILFAAMVKLNNPNLKFVQVGDTTPAIERYKDQLNIEVTGKLPPEQAFRRMASADILYLKQGVSIKECIAAKTYEYLTTGRPILAECSESADAVIIDRYAPVSEIVTEPDVGNVLQALEKLVTIAKASDCRPDRDYMAKYNREYLTGQLAKTFDEICAENAAH